MQACRHPETIAFTFLSGEGADGRKLKYGELAVRARKLATRLRAATTQGERVLLLLSSGEDYVIGFFGCVYAGLIAVPLFPPKPRRDNQRIAAILEDSGASSFIALDTFKSDDFGQLSSSLRTLQRISPRLVDHEPVSPGFEAAPNDIAYIQYTSGSTASPKGIKISHKNLIANMQDLYEGWDHTNQSRLLTWLPPFHDMGLVYGLLTPVYGRYQSFVMAPASFTQRPASWLENISSFGITHSIGPNFAYHLCTEKIDVDRVNGLDLRSWKVAVNGSEPVSETTLQRFSQKFGPFGFDSRAFCPGYGLAEATLKVTAVRAEDHYRSLHVDSAALEHGLAKEMLPGMSGATTLVGCGRPCKTTRILIVAPETQRLCAENEVGEIWVASLSVASGYWRQESANAGVFGVAHEIDFGVPYLRTGDLGFLNNDELFVIGRLKDLVIVRGRNIYPQDIEIAIQTSNPFLRPFGGAAFGLEKSGESDELVIVQEVDTLPADVQHSSIFEAIRATVGIEFDVEVAAIVLIKPRTLPRTSSGKIQRALTRRLYLDQTLDTAAEWRGEKQNTYEPLAFTVSSATDWLRVLFAKVFRVSPQRMSGECRVTDFGLTSLQALEICHTIEAETRVVIPLGDLLDGMSLQSLASHVIRGCTEAKEELTTRSDIPDPQTYYKEYSLTASQESLLMLEPLLDGWPAYNIACPLKIHGALHLSALRKAWKIVHQRHTILNARFTCGMDAVMRLIPPTEVLTGCENAEGWEEERIARWVEEKAAHRFDLEKGPPTQLSVLMLNSDAWMCQIVTHHIVTDLWSMSILVDELFLIYEAETQCKKPFLLPTRQFVDYAANAQRELDGPKGLRVWDYWGQQLSGSLPVLDLPTDKIRPPYQTFKGASVKFQLDADVSGRVVSLAAELSTTVATILLTAYKILLSRYSGAQELIVGMASSMRERAAWANVIGYFTNVLPIRTKILATDSARTLVGRVRDSLLDGYRHQMLPFASMVRGLVSGRNQSRSPVFQSMFVFQEGSHKWSEVLASADVGFCGLRMQMGSFEVETLNAPSRSAQFDTSLIVARIRDGFGCRFNFNCDLYERPAIENLCRHFTALLDQITRRPDGLLAEMPVLSVDELTTVTRAWNDTAEDFDLSRCLHSWVEVQARRTPGLLAVISEEEQLTYRELDQRANALAQKLVGMKVANEEFAAVCMHRSAGLVIALLGVLKAGGAFLPLDPATPKARLSAIIEETSPRVVITDQELASLIDSTRTSVVTSNDRGMGDDESDVPPSDGTHPQHPAYCMFTSGSTGKPKGAVITHEGVVNRLLWMQKVFRLTPYDRVLQKTPISFDVSVWELFWPLMTGAAVVMAKPEGHKDPAYIAECVKQNEISVIHFVPSMLQFSIEELSAIKARSLRLIICSGEALSKPLCDRVLDATDAELHNLYGPTEASIDVTHWACRRDERELTSVPIGRPIANTEMYILDAFLNPVPAGVKGDLYIAGTGLARCYIDRPDLTAERFVPCPHGDFGARMYRTGDVARYRSDGSIEYLGRSDYQVKIRGCRVEPGEIEAVCLTHPDVRECIVVTDFVQSSPVLVAYAVPVHGSAVSAAQVREFLRSQLPEHMTPSGVVIVSAIPMLANGKADRTALPKWIREETTGRAAVWSSQTEELIARSWSEVLGHQQYARDVNFFDVGGNSLLLLQLQQVLQRRLQHGVATIDLFRYSTISSLASRLADVRSDKNDNDGIKRSNAVAERRRMRRTKRPRVLL